MYLEKSVGQTISKQTLLRLPSYLNYLKVKKDEGMQNISAPIMASDLNLNEVQVRKDIASVSKKSGKPKTGHSIDSLIEDIRSFLGYDNVSRAIIVGAGQLGRALLTYKGFSDFSLDILAAFDKDESLIGLEIGSKKVYSNEELHDFCVKNDVHIGIITVDKIHAQEVADTLVSAGIKGIWNFAPIHLKVPANIEVQNENLAASLAVLSIRISKN